MDRVGNECAVGKVFIRLGWRDSIPKVGRKQKREVGIPDGLDWLVWRLVVERVAKLEEVERYYDLVDVLDAHISLDLKFAAEALASEVE